MLGLVGPMAATKTRSTFSLDYAVVDRLKMTAEHNGTSASSIVEEAIRRHLLHLEALADHAIDATVEVKPRHIHPEWRLHLSPPEARRRSRYNIGALFLIPARPLRAEQVARLEIELPTLLKSIWIEDAESGGDSGS
jgi:predicted DNA-binding protein